MMLSVIPLIAWARNGTPVLLRDLLLSIGRPMLAGVVAGVLAFAPRFMWGYLLSPLPRLALGSAILAGVYLWILLYVLRQKQLYVDILRGFLQPPSADEAVAVSA
jgi:PST family polysaccharide transporter